MSNYNLERGQELYFNELNKQAKVLPDLSEDILKLGSLFGLNVGVMQEKASSTDFNFDDETCILSYDWTPSYKKLSVAIVSTATVNSNLDEKMSLRQMIEKVFESYPKHLLSNTTTIVKTEEEIVNDSSYQEILTNSESVFNLVEADELDGNAELEADELDENAELA